MKRKASDLSIDEIEAIGVKMVESWDVKIHEITKFSTAREALSLPCRPGRSFTEYYHSTDGGFGIRVMRARQNGEQRKTWIGRYRDSGRKDRKVSIAPASVENYESARIRAMEFRREAVRRRSAGLPAVPTLLRAFDDYEREGKKRWSESTKRMYRRAAKYFLRFAFTKVDCVTSKHIEDLIRDIKMVARDRYESFKNPTVEIDGSAAAANCMRIIRAIYRDLIAEGTVRYSPVAKLQRQGYFDRQTPKSDAIHREDFPKFWAWLHQSTHESTRDYILVALFMAFRRSLLSGMKWEHINHRDRIYRIPADAEGNKAKREIRFPIPAVLYESVFLPRWNSPNRDRTWVITSPRNPGEPLRSIRGALKAAQDVIDAPLTVHGLRRTSATLMHSATGSELLAARLLTHSLVGTGSRSRVTSNYIVTTEQDLREAMDKMVDFALALAKGKPRGASAGGATTVAAESANA